MSTEMQKFEVDKVEVEGGYRVTINGNGVDHLDLSEAMPEATANAVVDFLVLLVLLGEKDGTNYEH